MEYSCHTNQRIFDNPSISPNLYGTPPCSPEPLEPPLTRLDKCCFGLVVGGMSTCVVGVFALMVSTPVAVSLMGLGLLTMCTGLIAYSISRN